MFTETVRFKINRKIFDELQPVSALCWVSYGVIFNFFFFIEKITSMSAYRKRYVAVTNQIVLSMYLRPIRCRIRVCISHQSERRFCSLVCEVFMGIRREQFVGWNHLLE